MRRSPAPRHQLRQIACADTRHSILAGTSGVVVSILQPAFITLFFSVGALADCGGREIRRDHNGLCHGLRVRMRSDFGVPCVARESAILTRRAGSGLFTALRCRPGVLAISSLV